MTPISTGREGKTSRTGLCRVAAVAVALLAVPWVPSEADQGATPRMVRSTRGAVVSQAPLATAAGVRILELGGNAVDAAVGTAFALTVVEPTNSGLGGRTQVLVRTPDGAISALDGTNQVPASYPADTVVGPDLTSGYGMIGVPGTVAALTTALERHGTLPLSVVMAPAIELAEDGFPLGADQAAALTRVADDVRRYEGSRRYFLKDDGTPYAAGERFTQKDLAATLRAIASGGADAFYRGAIAERIAADMSANGGYVRRSDLEAYRVRDALIARGRYRDHELIGTYLPAAGANVVAMMAMLEHVQPTGGAADARWAAVVAQALQLGFQDRLIDLANMGPAEGFPSPARMAWLLDRDRLEKRAAAIRVPESAAGADDPGARAGRFPPGHTTHLSVVDGAGGAVALTQSLGPTLGSRVATPGLGFAYSATMGYLTGTAASAGIRSLGPGDRASSRQSPMMVLDPEGRLEYVIGASGSRRILSAIVQVLSRSIDHGSDLADAMAAPRVHVEPGEPEVVHVEGGEDAAWSRSIQAGLVALGFDVRNVHEQSFGNVSAIHVDAVTGVVTGVADPRAAGAAGAPKP